MTKPATVRCAIYTRKSSDEGLEQGFNSLDAQREACAAFVASQKHEGWCLLPRVYDDGGVSGGTLERPALQSLLADIEAGAVDLVVVYKIDRLTRSLADFARLVERFDARNCSFVSVTQAFNTATSMGRLTLNVLLSFAQFEREVTAERIRDKIAASKKKGMWMGGNPPLGYDPHPDASQRRLVVNPAEAAEVRALFDLYLQLGCLGRVTAEAKQRGIVSKRRPGPGRARPGGSPLSRGQVHYILTNPVYIGRIRHRSESHAGLHPAIIPQDLWDEVQAALIAGSRKARGKSSAPRTGGSLLLGRIRDETGDLLTPSHARTRGRRYDYYVSNRLLKGDADPAAWRLPAAAFERLLCQRLAAHLGATAQNHGLLAQPDAGTAAALAARASALGRAIGAGERDLVRELVQFVRLAPGTLTLELDRTALARHLEVAPEALAAGLATLVVPVALRRRGVEARVLGGLLEPEPDPVLVSALTRAHRWCRDIRAGTGILALAAREGHAPSHVRTRAPLAFLSPAIQSAILEGTQPAGLTIEDLARAAALSDWAGQERLLGLAGAGNSL